jgi:hypothetical protein
MIIRRGAAVLVRSRRRRLPVQLACALAIMAGVASTAAAQPLNVRLGAIRSAFVKNDPDALARQFPTKDRVFVSLPRFEAGAFLGPGPLRALLNRIAREARTVEFVFVDPERASAAASENSVYLKAEWTYRPADGDASRTEELYLSLRRQPEDGEWRVVELKASR